MTCRGKSALSIGAMSLADSGLLHKFTSVTDCKHIRRTAFALIAGAIFTLRVMGAGLVVDTANREEARVFFNAVYSVSEDVPMGFTGDVLTGNAGTTSTEYREAVRLRVNWFRAMAGIPADVAFSTTNNAKCQQAALMMSANDALDHTPPNNWTYYTADGASAAASSDLYLGRHGADAITGYIEDPGAENADLGHRRWVLYPQTQTMGTGDVPTQSPHFAANALWVFDSNLNGTRPTVRDEFVAWPPPGFVPYQLVFPRWSFSYPGANFSSATVTLTRNNQTLANTLEPIVNGYGENTIAWIPADQPVDDPRGLPVPAQDVVTTVAINGVVIGGQTRNFTYTVKIFDPAKTGADTVLANITGPGAISPDTTAEFTCAAVPRATGYDWEVSTASAFAASEGAENGTANVTAKTSAGYNVVADLHASGAKSFHLACPDFTRQTLELKRLLVPGATSQLQWKSRLGWAGNGQTARVQISLDDGRSWQDVFSQTGTNTSGEANFTTRSASLANFAGRAIRVRFSFDYTQSLDAYTDTDEGVGWYLDDISVTAAEELTPLTTTHLDATTAFTFPATSEGERVLRARAVFYDTYPSEWAPVKRVSISTTALLSVSVSPSNGGSVTSGFLGNTVRTEGTQLSVKATPAAGYFFTGWTGGLTSAQPTLAFTMPFSLSLTANFIPTPWPTARGVYRGLVASAPGSSTEAGKLTVTLNANGTFTGSIIIAGRSAAFSGKLDASGNALFGRSGSVQFARRQTQLTLAFQVAATVSPVTTINATLTASGGAQSLFAAQRSLYSSATNPTTPFVNVPVALLGAYTTRLSATVPNTANQPRGDGYARMVVSKSGGVTLTGALADGKKFTAGAALRTDGTWPLFRLLHDGKGSLSGNVTLADMATSDVSATLRWFRPAIAGRFPSGWPTGLDVDLLGSHYTRPVAPSLGAAVPRVLAALDVSLGAATVNANDASFTATWPALVATSGNVTPAPAATDKSLRGIVELKTGIHSGTFKRGQTTISYRGAVLQKEGIFAGYYLTPDDGGRIRLAP